MPLTLTDYQIEKCNDLLKQLLEFKSAINSSELQSKVNNLHMSFTVFDNSFEIKPSIEYKKIVESKGEIEHVRINNVLLMVYKGLVIGIDEKYRDFGKLVINKTIDIAADIINDLWDYENRSCDKCGQYFKKPGFEIPIIRLKQVGYTLAFHEKCIN